MSTYSFGDGITYYQAMIRGDLVDGPGAADWSDQQDQVHAAGRKAAPFARSDVHVVFQSNANDEPAAARWVVDGDVTGPEPTWETEDTGPAFMTFRFALTDAVYPRVDSNRPVPISTDMSDVVVAALARRVLGTTFAPMPTTAHTAMGFAPRLIEYSQNLWTPMQTDITEPLVGQAFHGVPESSWYMPTVWVVPTGQTQGAMISACYDTNGNRWDDPDRPTPAFEVVPL